MANAWFFAVGADCLLVSNKDAEEARRMIGLKLRELLRLSVQQVVAVVAGDRGARGASGFRVAGQSKRQKLLTFFH